jgi:hypothetical protein
MADFETMMASLLMPVTLTTTIGPSAAQFFSSSDVFQVEIVHAQAAAECRAGNPPTRELPPYVASPGLVAHSILSFPR